MLASKYNITIQRGGTFSIAITSKDENAVPTDFSGYDSMRLHVRPAWVGKPGSITSTTEPLLSLSTTSGEITNPDANTIQIDITAAATAGFTFNSGKFELEMITNAVVDPPTAEIVDKLLYGTVTVTGEIIV